MLRSTALTTLHRTNHPSVSWRVGSVPRARSVGKRIGRGIAEGQDFRRFCAGFVAASCWRGGSLGSHAARSARIDHRDPGTGPVWLGKWLPSQDRSIMTESGTAPCRSSRPACFDSSSRGSRQVLAPHTLRDHYPIFTSMVLGLAFSDFGRWTSSTPSLYSATTPLPSASSGIVKLRPKRPYARSTR